MYVRRRCQHLVGTELAKSSERITACSGGGCEQTFVVCGNTNVLYGTVGGAIRTTDSTDHAPLHVG